MTRFLTAAALAVLLSSCAVTKPEPVVHTVPVNIPVPMPCVSDDIPPAPGQIDPKTGKLVPDYPDTLAALKAAPELADFEKLLDAGSRLRDKRLELLEAVIAKCRTIKPLTVAK